MDFCSKCGSRLVLKKVMSGNQALLVLDCSKCGEKIRESNEAKNNRQIYRA
jgi:DNA-directed RNA polymerase subunit M/transcription elongation factor TFIIS